GLDQIDQFDEVFRWVTRTETGDRAELSNLPENLPFWRHIDARSDTCLGQKCPDYEPCFLTRMRQRAIDADVIVVSHHLFFADLFWISFHEGRGLDGRFALTPRVAQVANLRSDQNEEDESQVNNLRHNDAYHALDNALNRLETALDILKDAPADAENILRRTRQLRFDLNFIVSASDRQFVYWLERRGRGVFLRASPIDVSGLLQDKLFEKVPTVVLISATL